MKKLDRLRRQVNEAVWTGQVEDCKGLVSLKDILSKDKVDDIIEPSEQYIMLSNVVESEIESSEGTSTQDKDKQIIINRISITFNGQECKLLTFTDVTIYQRLKL